jgi:hypothetical protein
MLRRRFTRLGQGVIDFDGVEVFPCGPKKTKRYCKQLREARNGHAPPDGRIMRGFPELIASWPLGFDAAPTVRAASNPSQTRAPRRRFISTTSIAGQRSKPCSSAGVFRSRCFSR